MTENSPIQPRTAVVTIYGGDYLDRIRHLENKAAALEEAIEAAQKEEATQPRLAHEVPDSFRLIDEHNTIVGERNALHEEADATALHVRVQHLPRKVWKALVAAHPPRTVERDNATEKQERSDALSGLNDETFKDALVYDGEVEVDGLLTRYCSIIEPAGITAEQIDQFSDIDFDRIYFAAFAMNRGSAAPDPKASLVSRLTQTSSETSS